MDSGRKITTENPGQTQKLGEDLAIKDLNRDKSIIYCLYGPLGAGKTTLVSGYARGLGISSRILSPTFIIMKSYILASGFNFYHLDLYRIDNPSDLHSLNLNEIISGKRNIVWIEWAEKMPNKPVPRTDIYCRELSTGKHEYKIVEVIHE